MVAKLLKHKADPNAQTVKGFRKGPSKDTDEMQDATKEADDNRLPRIYQHPYRPLLHVALKVPDFFQLGKQNTTTGDSSLLVV